MLPPDIVALRDDNAYVAAMDELDGLALAEPDTPAGRRFDELVRLIEEYDALRHGYLLLPRAHRAASAANFAKRATEASPSVVQDFPERAARTASAHAPRG